MKSIFDPHSPLEGRSDSTGIVRLKPNSRQSRDRRTQGKTIRPAFHATDPRPRFEAGSVLAVTLIIILALGIIIAAVTSIVSAQRRIAIHREAAIIANNNAESALDYAYSYVMQDIKTNSITTSQFVPAAPTTGTTPNVQTFTFPTTSEATSFLSTLPTLPTSSGYSGNLSNIGLSFNNLSVVVESPTVLGFYQVDPNAPANANSPIKSQWVTESVIPVVAQVKATWENQSYTSYMQKSIDVIQVPLFQNAIFFQGSLMLHRGYPDLGSIHTNGNLAINAHNDDTANYSGQLSASKRFFRGEDFEGSVHADGPYAYNPINTDGTWNLNATVNSSLVGGGSSGGLNTVTGYGKISLYNGTAMKKIDAAAPPTDSTNAQWTNRNSSTAGSAASFNGWLMDQSQSVPVVNPTGSTGYAQDDPTTPTTDEFNNGPYSLIEPLLPTTYSYNNPNYTADGTHGPANFTRPSDNSNNLEARASLILRIECTQSTGLPVGANTAYGTVTSTSWDRSTSTATPTPSFGQYFVVKAYKNPSTNWGSSSADPSTFIPVALPMEVIGQADDSLLNPSSSDSSTTNVFATQPSSTAATLYYRSNRILGVGYGNGSYIKRSGSGTTRSPYTYSYATTVSPIVNGDGTFESYAYNGSGNSVSYHTNAGLSSATNATVALGLHDPRMARGVNLLTIDIGKLKAIMEADSSSFSTTTPAGKAAKEFRDTFNVATEWNGIIYVEFPTSLQVSSGTPQSVNATDGVNSALTGSGATDGVASWPFSYASPELRHPDRMADTEDTTSGSTSSYSSAVTTPANGRFDGIVPVAPQLRGYPPVPSGAAGGGAISDSTIENSEWSIPALQIINAQLLPNTNPSYQSDSKTTPSTIGQGFSIAANAPLYLVGSYNSDGNNATPSGSNYLTTPSATTPFPYMQPDVATSSWAGPEVPSALFCDYLTVLSNNWGTNRPLSEPGISNASNNRMVTTGGVEISACIATGEYPIFEFMLHALEDWTTYYGGSTAANHNPIVIRGSVCGMFHSEFQHIKQAYSRNPLYDIQVYWNAAGAFAIPAVRFSQWLSDGVFPPGTPNANIYSQRDFRLLRPGDSSDMTIINNAGFTYQNSSN